MDIKNVIKAHGMTVGDVAAKLGIRRETLSRNLSNNPTLKTMQLIAGVLGCSVGEFFADELEPPKFTCPHCGKPISIHIGEN